MPGGGEQTIYISVRKFLEEADEDAVNTFKEKVPLSSGNCRRVEFWRKSVAADHPTLLSLFREYCEGELEQLKDVSGDDEKNFEFKRSLEDAQKYAEELRSRMEADLSSEFSNWKGKYDAINNSEPRGKPNKFYSIQ